MGSNRPRIGGRTVAAAALVVVAIAVAVLTTAVTRSGRDTVGRTIGSTSVSVAGPQLPPSVGIIGDSTSVGTGDPTGQGWIDRLTKIKCWSVRTSAVSDTGYVTAPPGGRPFPDRVRDATVSQPELVIVQGGAADVGATPAEIVKAARVTFAAIRSDAPEREIVVIGPIAAPRYDRNSLARVTTAIRTAAGQERAVFIDPVSYGWLRRDQYAADRTNPDGTGYVRYAQRVSDFLLQENLVSNCTDRG